MNRNVFMRLKATVVLQSEKPKEEVTLSNNLIDFPPSNPLSSKYNPDVISEYELIKNDRLNKSGPSYEHTKEMWKGITGENMDFDPKNTKNFICAKDVKDFEGIKSATENEFAERERERLENEEQMKLLREQALEAILKLEDEYCGDDVNENIVVFSDLKLSAGSQTSELSEEQKGYNALLSEISKL